MIKVEFAISALRLSNMLMFGTLRCGFMLVALAFTGAANDSLLRLVTFCKIRTALITSIILMRYQHNGYCISDWQWHERHLDVGSWLTQSWSAHLPCLRCSGLLQ